MKAILLADSNGHNPNRRAIYLMKPPYMGQDLIVLSTVCNRLVKETYIFPGTYTKTEIIITDWTDLEGSKRGVFTDREILHNIGYDIVGGEQ